MPDFRAWGDPGHRLMMRLDDGLVLILPHALMLTVAVLALYGLDPCRRGRPDGPDIGWLVCLVATACALVVGGFVLAWIRTDAYYSDKEMILFEHADRVAFAVAACRSSLFLSGYRGRPRSWKDGLGRMLGWAWIAAAVTRYLARTLPFLI